MHIQQTNVHCFNLTNIMKGKRNTERSWSGHDCTVLLCYVVLCTHKRSDPVIHVKYSGGVQWW